MKKEQGSFKQKIKTAGGFYIILAVCLLAAGAGSYFTARLASNSAKEESASQQTSTQIQTREYSTYAETQVNEIVTGVPDERYSEQETSETTQETAANIVTRAASFSLPLGSSVSKDYSYGELVASKTMGDWRAHTGVDFAGTTGDPVKAVNNGIVTAVYDDALWGTVVEIDHGEGMTAKYCGLGKGSTVNIGDEVSINDKVGNLGEIPIEEADGVHLHFEITIDGEMCDPIAAMGKNPESLS